MFYKAKFFFHKIILLFILSAIIITYRMCNTKHVRTMTVYKEKKNELKTILFWNSYHDFPDYFFGFGHKPFVDNCVINNCYATNNKSYMSADKFDAVLIHGPTFQPSDISDLPAKRSPNQYYVIISHECPAVYFGYDGYPDLNNITINFRLTADIFMPFYRIYDTEGKFMAPKHLPFWLPPDHDMDYLSQFKDIYERKSKPVAWIVSNCLYSYNKRNEYTSELQKYINVDIFGGCGTSQCAWEGNTSCANQLKNDYFFYLAFENANCVEYVTEKLHNAMGNEVIPVTMNAADMTKMAPPYSFIDARKYEPKELAEYLKFLMANPMEYLKYHWWRNNYYIEKWDIVDSLCGLCEFLNREDKGEHKSIKDYQSWYRGSSGNRICTEEILESSDYIPVIDPDTDFEVQHHAVGISI